MPVKSKASVELTASIYYFTDVSILADAARVLGKTADADRYVALAGKIRDAINAKYLNAMVGTYNTGIQTELSAPLHWGVGSDNQRSRIATALARRVRADSSHIDVGLLGTKTILNALSDNVQADLAYTLAARETFPAWGWWIKNGATTLYENWPIDAKSDISMNHIMFGEIGAWYYKVLGGIKLDPAQPGFKNVRLELHSVAGLNEFEAEHDGPFGTIRSAWKRAKKGVTYTVTVPPNSPARLKLPNSST